MDFALTEDQLALRDLAARLFTDLSGPARVGAVEGEPDRFDAVLWSALADAGLLGTGLPVRLGGLGLGLVDLAVLCRELGAAVAPVPLVWTLATAAALAEHGSADQQQVLERVVAGAAVLTSAAPASAQGVRLNDRVLHGSLVGVPAAHLATVILVPVGGRLFYVDPSLSAVTMERGEGTDRQVHCTVHLDHVPAMAVGGPGAAEWLWRRTQVLLAAAQAGVTAAALRMAAEYTSARLQFGKPLSSFQGVAFRAADGYISNSVIWAATLQAAWRIDRGSAEVATDEEATAVLTAAWWAAQAGQECVHAVQHIHGGIGADVTYPVHRYFLWGKQIEMVLGGGSSLLASLGDRLAAMSAPGDALVSAP